MILELRLRAQQVGNVLHGRFEEFHANGRRAVGGDYRNGVPHGEFTRWDENGTVTRRTLYDRGEIVWTTTDPDADAPRIGRDDVPRVGTARPIATTQVLAQLGAGARAGVAARPAADPGPDRSGHAAAGVGIFVRHRFLYAGPTALYAPGDRELNELYLGLAAGVSPRIRQVPWLVPEVGLVAGRHRFGKVGGQDCGYFRVFRAAWKSYVGIEANGAITLSRYLDLVGAVHLRQDLGGDEWTLRYTVCDVFTGECMNLRQDWKLGGTDWGAGLYLRFVAR